MEEIDVHERLRSRILATTSPREAVQWDEETVVYVAAMSGAERDGFERSAIEASSGGSEYAHLDNFRARLLVRCLVDESGARLFTDGDAVALGKVWCTPLDKAFTKAKKLNGFSLEDVKELEGK